MSAFDTEVCKKRTERQPCFDARSNPAFVLSITQSGRLSLIDARLIKVGMENAAAG